MAIDDARNFLDSIGAYLGSGSNNSSGSTTNGIKLATLGNASVGDGLYSVIFDGETKASAKTYAWVGSYIPTTGDRVIMIPAGNSYVILGYVATDVLSTSRKHARAEYTTTNFGVLAQPWDTGPVTLDTSPTKTVNNNFSGPGPFNGSIYLYHSGYYSISCMYIATTAPGSGWLKLNHSSGELLGMDSIIANAKHEGYISTVPTYFAAGQYVRSSLSVSQAHTGSTRWKVVRSIDT